jgi:hypothetical protein
MEETNGLNDPTRLDRIERIIELLANSQVDMQQDIKILLRGQIAIGEAIEKLTVRVDQLAEAQQHTDRRMDALILIADEIVRGRKTQ